MNSCDNVILIFSVTESHCFQGIARIEKGPNHNYKHDYFKLFITNSLMNESQKQLKFQPFFNVRWLITCQYAFKDLEFLPGNALNEGYPIQKSYNGQEIDFDLANLFCNLLYSDKSSNHKVEIHFKPQDL